MVGGLGPLGPGSGVRYAASGTETGCKVVVASSFNKQTIRDIGNQFRGKKVLIRVDFNGTAKDGKTKSTGRIDAALETIQYVLDQGAAQVILISHNGRNKDIAKDGAEVYSLAPVASALQERLSAQIDRVDFVSSCTAPVTSTARVVLMENTRVDARDEKGDITYAQEILAAVSPDIYVLDGFSVAHRDQASVTLLARLMKDQGKPAVAGALLAREYEFFIDRVIKNPAKPFLVFLGGSKVGGKGGKLPILTALLPEVDRLVVGGAMAFPFLLAQGLAVAEMDPFKTKPGRNEELAEEVRQARAILEGPYGYKVLVPTQVVGVDKSEIDVRTTAVPAGFVMRDSLISGLMPQLSVVSYGTIFFNGTFGAYEEDLGGHVKGTHEVFAFMARAIATGAMTIPGGGDTAEVLKGFKKTPDGNGVKFGHETTGGGASGDLITLGFAGRAEELAGFACLTDRMAA
ncbi:MAG: phosphoglycerate kinase [Candidatus Saganbacteria bacterium]|nr:phosphoglycerate kinase [Candidatus Saganbacteria bacterium]